MACQDDFVDYSILKSVVDDYRNIVWKFFLFGKMLTWMFKAFGSIVCKLLEKAAKLIYLETNESVRLNVWNLFVYIAKYYTIY